MGPALEQDSVKRQAGRGSRGREDVMEEARSDREMGRCHVTGFEAGGRVLCQKIGALSRKKEYSLANPF